MSNENKGQNSEDLSKFDVYDESELGQYEDPNCVHIELSEGQMSVQEPDGTAYIIDENE
jgi:hypothetical protein